MGEMLHTMQTSQPSLRLNDMLLSFESDADFGAKYFTCNLLGMRNVAALIEDVPLPLKTQFAFCMAPVGDEEAVLDALQHFAKRMHSHGTVHFSDVQLSCLEHVPRTPVELEEVETFYKVVDLYLWLALRFASAFPDHDQAQLAQKAAAALINEGLLLVSEKDYGRHR